MRGGIRRISDSLHVRFDIIQREDYCDAMVFCSSCHVNFYVFPKMCGREVEGAKFLFIFVRVPAVGRALPATLAWWILWRWVNYSSLCVLNSLSHALCAGCIYMIL